MVDAVDSKTNDINKVTIKTLQKQRYDAKVKVEIVSALQEH